MSQNKFIETSNIQKPTEYSRQTPRIFNWFTDIFEKFVDPLNTASIFNVNAFLHGICK